MKEILLIIKLRQCNIVQDRIRRDRMRHDAIQYDVITEDKTGRNRIRSDKIINITHDNNE